MKSYFLLLLFIIFSFTAFAQTVEPYHRDWKKADSLMQRGLPQSAAGIAQSVYDRALRKNDQIQMMKAQLYLISADFQRKDDAFRDAVQQAEKNTSASPFPYSAIWQNITAQLYWSYYQQNRWKILDRTNMSGTMEVEDFQQWDARRFFEKIAAYYLASLSRSHELETIKIDQYEPILIKAVNTGNLRPTLFDLLAFHALEYFEHQEKDIIRPVFSFVMNDARAFSPANEFIHVPFKSKDSTSLQWQALKLYQRILTSHNVDQNRDALIDADLHRIEFVYRSSVHPDRKNLYKKALEQLAQQYSSNPLSALASYRIAQLMLPENNLLPSPRISYSGKAVGDTDYPAVKQLLEKIIEKFPQSEGGILAKQALQQILSAEINLTVEEVVLPDEPSKALISYRNVPRIWLRLVRLDNAQNKFIGSYHSHSEKRNNEILSLPHIREWSVALPATEDYERHSAEIKIDGLGTGTYALIASSRESFPRENNILGYALFQVSRLSAVIFDRKGFVLDRKSGMPLNDAKIDLYVQQYNNNIRDYNLIRKNTMTTDENGVFTWSGGREYYQAIGIRRKGDTVILPGYFSTGYVQPQQEPRLQTFFFTDRAVYRPGQDIFFKGILLRKENGTGTNTVMSGENTVVTLYDVNGQKVVSKNFTTNEFGSFSGSFTAPEGLLNGRMRIENENGSVDFSVEEYKRPKFSVSFDTVRKAYALNDMIKVSGRAVAYAGNNIGNAKVQYRVVRNARFPYWWYAYMWGFPQSPEMEIANGVAITNDSGNFEINFEAIPDAAVAEQSMPVFTYTVTADVTDINGETRSGTGMVSAGYASLHLAIRVPENARPEDMDTISISSLNLNNQFVAADVRLRIFKLKEPDRVLRKRLWKTPDQFVMDSLDFKRFFPDDVYRDEDNHLTWDVKKTLLDRSIRTAKKGWVTVPSEVWSENGWYVIEVMTGDKNGRQLTEKKYVQIWSERNEGNINAPLAVIPQTQSKEPGEEAKVYAVSGYGRIHLLQQVRDMSGKTDYTHIDFTGKPVRWEKRIISSDRGGISVNYVTVKENRFYQQQAFITIPWSNKDLNIRWETHRDKLLPGGKETWTMVIQGDKKEKLAAEMVATLYDASLDAFRPHKWNIYGLFPSLAGYGNGNAPGFGPYEGRQIGFIKTEPVAAYQKRYAWLYLRELSGTPSLQTAIRRGGMLNDATAKFYNSPLAETASAVQAKEDAFSDIGFTPPIAETSVEAQANAGIQKEFPVRKNLRETAFFFPHLRTDREGNVRMEFNMPEALTEWKLMTFAHTRDMSYGMMEGSVKTQKDLMITPNLPRFLRQGDEMTVSARISNLGDNSLNGIATLELLDATTMQPVHLAFRLEQKEQKFTAAKGQSTMASWKLHIPESTYEPVVIRVLAQSGSFTDGEEHIIPVVTNRMLVTETLPLWINGNGTKTFSFDKLRHSDTGRSLVHHALTVEYSGNPAWYAVQSLPYLMEYPYECAEQTFNRYYATALAAHIVQQSPRIKAIFDKWKEQAVFSSSSSPLENNQELKSALLEETPWVMEAKTETEQRKRLGQLFDAYRLSRDMDAAIRKLYDMQLPEGGFSWFKGMRSNRFITQYIITGLGRLQQLGVKDNSGSMQQIIKKALPYLDRQMKESYDLLVRDKARLDQQHISYPEIQYLYMRSFFKPSVESGARIAYRYYLSQAAKYWPDFNPYMKGMIALALYRNNDKETPEAIIQSLKETALNNEETGMYWMQRGQSYWWYAAPIEAQSLLVECFNEVVNDRASVDAMKIWLLKNKQTQSWETTRATADACYALLLSGTDWLKNEPKVVLELGDMTMNSTQQVQDAGSGYFKVRYAGKLVKSDAGNIRLNVTGNANSTSWGAVYWQYFEDIDKISSAATPLKIKKQLFIERNTDRGPELYPVNPNNALHIGDKIKVRIEIIVDRDMEYVHLKDMRAAAFEPVNVISAYKWQGGLGYYESTKDLSTSFFFDYLRKGKYVFEYPVFVQQTGNFSAGIATIQCMYAPEFSGHSDGIRIAVTAD